VTVAISALSGISNIYVSDDHCMCLCVTDSSYQQL